MSTFFLPKGELYGLMIDPQAMTLNDDNVLTLKTTGAVAETVSPKDFGAKFDGTTDDSTAWALWWAYLMANECYGYINAGRSVVNTAQVWNMTAKRTGLRIIGAGCNRSILDLRGATGAPFVLTASLAMFYGNFEGFSIWTNYAGPGVQLGALGGSDAMNGFSFKSMEFKNTANDTNAIALQVNGAFNCDFSTITTNTGGGLTPPAVGGASAGVSLQLRKSAFSRYMGSFSQAETGVHITAGVCYANFFQACDIEVVNRGIVIDSSLCTRNTIMSCQIAAATVYDFTAGINNVIMGGNAGFYSGGATVAGVSGMFLQQPGVGVTTPGVPATNTPVTNTTGRIVWVIVGNDAAGITAIKINSSNNVVTGGTFVLQPGETITLVYASGSPAWVWRALL